MSSPGASGPQASLSVLHLEDNPADAELVHALLEAGGIQCEVHRVSSRGDFLLAMERRRYDLILSDYSLPSFDGFTAMELARKRHPSVPLIFVSGTIGEEIAVESLKSGAVDYVLKDRLHRLVPAVVRALDDARRRSQHLKVQEELHRRDELFRQITENVADLIGVHDLDGRWKFVSPSFRRLFADAEGLVGCDPFERVHADDRDLVRRLFAETVATGAGRLTEFKFIVGDGSVRHVEAQGSVINDESGVPVGVVVVSRDVTARKEAEARIREQAALLEQVPDAIFVCDLGRRITYWNPGAERLYRRGSAEMTGRPAEAVLGGPAWADTQWEAVLMGGEWTGEIRHDAGAAGEIVVSARWTLLRGASGAPASVLCVHTDVTERKRLEAQLLRSQRLENLGALAGGIAHDLNNILVPMLMVSDVLRDEIHDEGSRQMLDTVKTSAVRGSELVKQILSFARGVGGALAPVNPGQLVKDMARLARDTFPRSIRIEIDVAAGLSPVMGDVTQIHQVLLNLCVNARDALASGGTLRLEASNTELSPRIPTGLSKPVAGPFVRLCVSDTGCGIPPGVMGRIFEPFFTTKAPGSGTGLGLSTVRQIVLNHGGFVEVESREGAGTKFSVFLPAATGAATSPAAVKPPTPPAGRNEQILLVEDDRAVLEMTKATLEAFHYRVLVARDGAEAAGLYREHRSGINLVITDLMMPVMDGPALIRELHEMNPSVKIVCVSGLTSEAKLVEVNRDFVSTVLSKPFTTAALLGTVREALSHAESAGR
jgi:PAS domain S-box-containing protein